MRITVLTSSPRSIHSSFRNLRKIRPAPIVNQQSFTAASYVLLLPINLNADEGFLNEHPHINQANGQFLQCPLKSLFGLNIKVGVFRSPQLEEEKAQFDSENNMLVFRRLFKQSNMLDY